MKTVIATGLLVIAIALVYAQGTETGEVQAEVNEIVPELELADAEEGLTATAHRRKKKRGRVSKGQKKQWKKDTKELEDITKDFEDCYGNPQGTSNSYTNCGGVKKLYDWGKNYCHARNNCFATVWAADAQVKADVWSKVKSAFGVPSNLQCKDSKGCNKLRKAWNGLKEKVNAFADWSKNQQYKRTSKYASKASPKSCRTKKIRKCCGCCKCKNPKKKKKCEKKAKKKCRL